MAANECKRVRLIRDVSLVTNRTVFVIGMLGGALNSGIGLWTRALGWSRLDQNALLATWIVESKHPLGSVIGVVLAVLAGGCWGYGYGFILRSARRSGLSIGLVLGFIHWVVAGLGLGVLSVLHPLVPRLFISPGIFALNLGFGSFASYFISHLAFGALVGLLFDRAAIRRPENPNVAIHHRP